MLRGDNQMFAKKGGEYAEGGEADKKPKEPIYVTNKKDPKLKAYKDSMSAFESTDYFRKNLPNGAKIKKASDPTLAYETHTYSEYLDPKLKPTEVVAFDYTKEFPLYKKPVQPIKYINPVIAAKQQKLKDAGFDVKVDGIWGKKSEEAYQQLNKISETSQTPKVAEESSTKVTSVNPVGKINIHGQDIPYFDEAHRDKILSTLKDYSPTKVGNTNNYTVDRFEEKTKGWKDGKLFGKDGKEIVLPTFKKGGSLKKLPKEKRYREGGEYDLDDKEIARLKKLGYDIEIKG
jgi:hypothetical protein